MAYGRRESSHNTFVSMSNTWNTNIENFLKLSEELIDKRIQNDKSLNNYIKEFEKIKNKNFSDDEYKSHFKYLTIYYDPELKTADINRILKRRTTTYWECRSGIYFNRLMRLNFKIMKKLECSEEKKKKYSIFPSYGTLMSTYLPFPKSSLESIIDKLGFVKQVIQILYVYYNSLILKLII